MSASVLLHDKQFNPFLSARQIAEKVKELATAISRDYPGQKPLFLVVLNGAFVFAADLFRSLSIEAEITFIKLASYRGTASSGKLTTAIGLEEVVSGRHVILVEDILDTGRTLFEFMPRLEEQQPASLRIVALLRKPEALQYPVQVDYCGFDISNRFVVGYGMDYNGLGRNIPDILVLQAESGL
jgi:hypoxanthine phosphoribosyltransferase